MQHSSRSDLLLQNMVTTRSFRSASGSSSPVETPDEEKDVDFGYLVPMIQGVDGPYAISSPGKSRGVGGGGGGGFHM